MKTISKALFEELNKASCYIATGWLITRTDGVKFGFTSSDIGFDLDGVTYTPANSFSGTAAVSKNNLSVDNMSASAPLSALLDEHELRGGKFDNASVKVFWIRPDKPEWGVVPIRGGTIGEVTIKGNMFETELRSVAQKLQQNVGDLITLECRVKELGDSKCKLQMNAGAWAADVAVFGRLANEAGVGTVMKPTVYNGFWYVCDNAPNTVLTSEPHTAVKFTGADGTKLWNKLAAVKTLHGMV